MTSGFRMMFLDSNSVLYTNAYSKTFHINSHEVEDFGVWDKTQKIHTYQNVRSIFYRNMQLLLFFP